MNTWYMSKPSEESPEFDKSAANATEGSMQKTPTIKAKHKGIAIHEACRLLLSRADLLIRIASLFDLLLKAHVAELVYILASIGVKDLAFIHNA